MIDSVIGNSSEVSNGVVPAKISANPDSSKEFVTDVNRKLAFDKKTNLDSLKSSQERIRDR